MKKIILSTALGLTVFLGASVNEAYTETGGAPMGTTGSPFDGNHCGNSYCHNVSPTNVTGWLDVPIGTEGYVPGNTYTIVATITSPGTTKAGFQVSAQNNVGNKAGTIVRTDITKTQLKSGGKYITHTAAGTSSLTWSFDWVAPAAGSGPVTFYGAFNASNADNGTGGDKIFLTSVAISEKNASSVKELGESTNFSVFPNPVSDILNVGLEAVTDGASLEVINLEGQVVKRVVVDKIQSESLELNLKDLDGGLYFVLIKSENGNCLRKIIKL